MQLFKRVKNIESLKRKFSSLEQSMIDVSKKKPTVRTATTQCKVKMNEEAFKKLKEKSLVKGDAISIAEIAGIIGAKQTPNLIPLCHQIALDFVRVKFKFIEESRELEIQCQAQVTDKTGCEMEAMVGASVAALTVYDMCKAIDRSIQINDLKLLSKTGGKSGDFKNV